MTIRINTRPGAQAYAAPGEKILEYSSPSGGGLISFREVDGRLAVDLYRHDDTVDVRVGAADGAPPASTRITPAARGYLARAAADAREAGEDPATQAALDNAARLGIRGNARPEDISGDVLQNVSDQLGEAFHASLRKGSDHPAASRAWRAIQELPGDEWVAVLNFLRSGLGLPERSK